MEQVVATQIRVGMILKVDGDLYKVNKTQHVTPGKGCLHANQIKEYF